MTTSVHTREPLVLLALTVVAFVVLGIAPEADRGTWAAEVAPVVVAVPLLVATHSRFPLTPLAHRLLFVHGIILMVGGHWTYAEVPVGHWVADTFDLSRNHYDRLGHFAQGFVPAIVARELLLRSSPLRSGGWLFALVTLSCLGISALYELVEWWAALLTGEGAAAFLGTQGDPWDTQWDMFLAGLGAATSQLALGARHDRQLAGFVRPAA